MFSTDLLHIYTYIEKDLNQNLQIWIHLSIRPVATDFLCNLADLRFFILIPSMSSTRITWCARCISMSCVRYCTPYRDISRFWLKVVWNYTRNYSFSVNLNCFIIRFNWGIGNKYVLWQTFRKTCPYLWRKKPERSSEILESCIAQVQTINKVISERTVLHVTLGLSWTIPCLQTVMPRR